MISPKPKSSPLSTTCNQGRKDISKRILKQQFENPFRVIEAEDGTLHAPEVQNYSLSRLYQSSPHDDQLNHQRQQQQSTELNNNENIDENGNHQKIWEKSPAGKSRTKWIKEFLSFNEKSLDDSNIDKKTINIHAQQRIEDQKLENQSSTDDVVKTMIEKLEQYISSRDQQQDKESLTTFLTKKRELFLLQLSINIKKDEIRKLDEKAQLKEAALYKSECMLEEDAIKFDTFLKDNDKKTQEVVRLAEKEGKKKMEKIQEIKQFNHQLQLLHSSIGKTTDSLEECLRFKCFLDALTPHSWFDEQAAIKLERKKKRRQARIDNRKQMWRIEQDKLLKTDAERKKTENLQIASKKRAQKKKNDINPEFHITSRLSPEPDFEDEPWTSSDEEIPMYFNRPQQLLELFSNLEEENLFLIQNTQEAEQSLDEMTDQFGETKNYIKQKENTLENNIQDIQRGIEARLRSITAVTDILHEGKNGASKQDVIFAHTLGKKVKELYQICGFDDAGSNPSILFMLSEIEACMEGILSRVERIPKSEFHRAEKIKAKERRKLRRAQQHSEQLKIQEERNKKALERSMLPPKKTVGRKVMYRSKPVRRHQVQEVIRELTQEEIDEIRHLT